MTCLQIMVLIAYAFMNKVISFYSFYRYAHEQTEFLQMVALIHLELEIFWSFLAIVVIKYATQVTKEGKKTSRIAHDIINRCHDPHVNLMLIHLSKQVQSRHPVASCGLFTFDWTVLFTVRMKFCRKLSNQI